MTPQERKSVVEQSRVRGPRILHVTGGTFGGVSRVVLDLSQAAVDAGFSVDILSTDPELIGHAHQRGFGVVNLDVIRRPVRPVFDFLGLLRLRRWLKTQQYAVVHTHTSKGGFIGRAAAHSCGVPLVIHTVHGFGFHDRSSWLEAFVFVHLERLAARWCDWIVTVSEVHRGEAIRRGIGNPNTVVAIPNGVKDIWRDTSPSEARAQLGWNENDLIIFSAGRLAEQKGYAHLIKAIRSVSARFERLKVYIAGEGPDRYSLERLIAALGLQDVIQLTGFSRQVHDQLLAADLVVSPSMWEGLSIFCLEAMAMGAPILTTELASNLEIAGAGRGTLELVPPGDPEALAAAIVGLLDDPDRRAALSKAARRRFEDAFSLDRMTDRYMELIRSELSGSPASGRA